MFSAGGQLVFTGGQNCLNWSSMQGGQTRQTKSPREYGYFLEPHIAPENIYAGFVNAYHDKPPHVGCVNAALIGGL